MSLRPIVVASCRSRAATRRGVVDLILKRCNRSGALINPHKQCAVARRHFWRGASLRSVTVQGPGHANPSSHLNRDHHRDSATTLKRASAHVPRLYRSQSVKQVCGNCPLAIRHSTGSLHHAQTDKDLRRLSGILRLSCITICPNCRRARDASLTR